MKIKDLGSLQGPLLIFGGIYSNLQALQAMQQIAKQKGFSPKQVICTGDVVAYCAQPEACVQAVKAWGIPCIAGNVELNLREGVEDCGCNFEDGTRCDIFSKQWYPFAQSKLSENSIQWMHSLPDHLSFRLGKKRIRVIHGSLHEVAGYVFESTPWAVKADQLGEAQVDVILAGHCGLPFSSKGAGGLWLNAGVIGMPANDGTPRVWYATIEEKEGEIHFQHHHFTYDHHQAQRLMVQENLPAAYSNTLLSGIWDNCDILPEAETGKQGERIGL